MDPRANLADLLPGRTGVKALLYVLAAIVAAVLLWQVGYRLFFQGQDLAKERGDRIVAEEQVQAEGQIVDGALAAVKEREVFREHITTVVRDGVQEVENAWNGEEVGAAVDAAGAAALCGMHDSLCRPAGAEEVQPVR